MELLRFQQVTKDYGHRPVLIGVSFRIDAGEKAGLIGANGAGKTTILRLLLREEQASGGVITRAPGLRVGYVPQHGDYDESRTALECVLAENTAASELLRQREGELAAAAAEQLDTAVDAYETARLNYERAGGDRAESQATAMLDALGLDGQADVPVAALSGGEKNVLSLARAVLAEPDLLVLDEPGNHLDFAGMAWLEDFLARFKGAVLLVSHNRYLLDRVAQTILHVEAGAVTPYRGNYSAYRATSLREKLGQQADYVVNQRRLAQLEALVKRFEELARRTADPAWGKRLRARKSQLARERRDAVERPVAETSKLKMRFETEATRAEIALQIRGYTKSFGDLSLFENAGLDISCGERVALLGANGCGKTTLVRDIVAYGAWDHDVIRVGPSLRVGYCAQEQEVLHDERTVLGEMVLDGDVTKERAFGILSQVLFTYEDLTKRVGDLSGGERNRLQLAKLILQQPDFLILDEPTNHLDIRACEAIEEALADFPGTILVVSHDRYFLDKIAGRVVEVADRQLISHDGSFSEFWLERQAASRQAKARLSTRRSDRQRPPGAAPTKVSGRQQQEQDELQRRIEEAEREQLAIESRVADAFSRGDHVEGRRAAGQLERHRARIDELYRRWTASR